MGETRIKKLPPFDFVSPGPDLKKSFNTVRMYRWIDIEKLVSEGYISAKLPTTSDERVIHPEECSEFRYRSTECPLSKRDELMGSFWWMPSMFYLESAG